MTGLTDRADGASSPSTGQPIEQAHQRWEESMLRQIEALRQDVRAQTPERLALLAGGSLLGKDLFVSYWGSDVRISWPDLQPCWAEQNAVCSSFDAAVLLYYLRIADGTPIAGRWISFRELPGGTFYALAYQRYSGDRLSQTFGDKPAAYDQVCRSLRSWPLPAISEHAFAFQPLPRIHLAAVLWPGDEEFPPEAHILFDAAASHYMTTDGLALLGGGLAGRLVRQAATPTA